MISVEQALFSIGLALLSLLGSYLLINRNNIILKSAITTGLKINSNAIKSFFEEQKANITRAHSIIGSQGGDAKKLKQGEKLLSRELMKSNALLEGVLSSGVLSEELTEWVTENPDLILQLADHPIIQQFLSQKKPIASTIKPHPFGFLVDE